MNDIGEEVGFESSQLDDEGQNEESFIKEIHNKAFEGTSYDDIESTEYSSLQNEQHDRDHDLLSNLIKDNPVKHDDYWSSYGLPLYDSSRALSIILEPLDAPYFEIIFDNPFPLSPCIDLLQHEMSLCQSYFPFPKATSKECFPLPPLIFIYLFYY